MSATTIRALRLLSLLQNRRFWPGVELAARLEVSARTLRRDVEQLREMGYPVEAQRGVDGGYQLAAGAALPPLVLSDEEAVSLAVGLQSAVQAGSVVGIEESSVQALSKLIQVMPPRLRQRVDAAGGHDRSGRVRRRCTERRLRCAVGHRPGMSRLRAPHLRVHISGGRSERTTRRPPSAGLARSPLVSGCLGSRQVRLADLPSRPPHEPSRHRMGIFLHASCRPSTRPSLSETASAACRADTSSR